MAWKWSLQPASRAHGWVPRGEELHFQESDIQVDWHNLRIHLSSGKEDGGTDWSRPAHTRRALYQQPLSAYQSLPLPF